MAIGTYRASRRTGDESGFTILESTIALGLVFAILTTLMVGLAGSVRAVVSGRQRTAALALATQVLEQSRALPYAEVGHDLLGDTTLDDDPEISGSGSTREYNGEPLAGSQAAGSQPPFAPHRWTTTVGPATYTVTSYVTLVTGSNTDPVKRVSTVVSWRGGDDGDGGGGQVDLSTLLYNAVEPPDPLLVASGDADGGRIRVTGFLHNMDLSDATIFLPFAHGDVESRFIRTVRGFASTARSRMAVNTSLSADDLTGCIVTNSNKVAECPGAKAESVADNDVGTAPAEHDAVGPNTSSGGVVERRNIMRLSLSGTSEALSRSTAMSCTDCGTSSMGDGDDLPWHRSHAGGSLSASMPFTALDVSGRLATLSGTWRTEAAVDRNDVGDDRSISSAAAATVGSASLATFSHPAATLDGVVVDYTGLVKVGGTSVTASAAAGPGVAPAAAATSTVPVDVWDPAVRAYRQLSMRPGIRQEEIVAPFSLLVNGSVVTLSATITTREQVVATQSDGSVVRSGETALNHWLQVVVHMKVVRNGSTVADLTVDLDYGRLAATATYEPA